MTEASKEYLATLSAGSDLQAVQWERFAPARGDTPMDRWTFSGTGSEARVEDHVRAWGEKHPEWEGIVCDTAEALQRLWRQGVQSIPITDPRYPPQLRSIDLPPLVLHVRGDVRHLGTGIAIVGSRQPSEESAEVARSVATSLAKAGTPVITGMALGTDRVAAKATLAAGGTLIGVVPGGPLDIVPKASASEYDGACLRGCIVSETTGRHAVKRSAFLRRNRITSGLARVIVVPATKETGGTINQLEWARRQGRPSVVFRGGAPPGFDVKVPITRIPYHLVGQDHLYEKAIDLWTSPRMSPQSALATS